MLGVRLPAAMVQTNDAMLGVRLPAAMVQTNDVDLAQFAEVSACLANDLTGSPIQTWPLSKRHDPPDLWTVPIRLR
jgi:hypothetical protein